jgi:NAD(P)H-dependent FMN reductase
MYSKWNVSIVSGASREGRHSVRVARNIENQLQEREDVGRIHFLDVEQFNFPNYIDGAERSEELNERLHAFSSSLLESDAVILVSPEYNGGMAGSMKNALDYFRAEYTRRPFGLVSVSAGTMGGINAMHQMVDFVSYVGGWLCGKRLLVSLVQNALGAEDQIVDERLKKDSADFLNELMLMVSVVRSERSLQR